MSVVKHLESWIWDSWGERMWETSRHTNRQIKDWIWMEVLCSSEAEKTALKCVEITGVVVLECTICKQLWSAVQHFFNAEYFYCCKVAGKTITFAYNVAVECFFQWYCKYCLWGVKQPKHWREENASEHTGGSTWLPWGTPRARQLLRAGAVPKGSGKI